jgi:hypothetical protein
MASAQSHYRIKYPCKNWLEPRQLYELLSDTAYKLSLPEKEFFPEVDDYIYKITILKLR